jgi:hypothetical protein
LTEPLTPEIEMAVNTKIETLKEEDKKPIQAALAKLKQQTEKQQNKKFSDSLKEIIDKSFTAIEVAYFIKTTELINQYVNEEMKKNPEKAS